MNAALCPLTIYYDASCPLCAQEMHALKRHDHAERLVLVDCSPATFDAEALQNPAVTRAALMQAIHARDAAGRWFNGVDVFVLAYEAAGATALARLWRHRTLRLLWDRLYPWVARNRQALSRWGVQYLVRALIAIAARRTHARYRPCAGVCAPGKEGVNAP